MAENERNIREWIGKYSSRKKDEKIFVIPVVFHVLYNKKEENISNAQIYSQLDVLNEDYRRLNYDAYKTPDIFNSSSADCQIEFCLASRDPDGNPTTGIIRKKTEMTIFSSENDDMKYSSKGGDDIWDRDSYLNIWICNLSNNVAGFSSYPGWNRDIDGIVIFYQVVGRIGNHNSRYNIGRTLTHEAGHWLSLYHPWGEVGEECNDGCTCSDLCTDTPVQYGANYNCPSYPHYSCSDTSDMFMNYMDYTNDACMNIFTNCQKLRMLAILSTVRAKLQLSEGCNTVQNPPQIDFTSDIREIPKGKSVNFTAITNQKIKHWLWLFPGAKPDTSNLQFPKDVFYYNTGKFTVSLIATNDNGMSRVTKYQYIKADTLGMNKDINIKYQYYKDDSLHYYYNYNSLTIEFGKGAFYNVKIRLYNLMGKEVASVVQDTEIISENHKIILPLALSNNIYILHIMTHNGDIYRKLMIMH
jgi:PKD repeat protein